MTQIQEISSPYAPPAVGPYSQAIKNSGLLFCSGQIALDPEQGILIGDDAASQAEQALKNLSAILQAGGSNLNHVLKTTIYLTSMDSFQAVNKVYERFFSTHKPARSTVAVKELPLGALVEIEAIARVIT